jgi:hypothetical protein
MARNNESETDRDSERDTERNKKGTCTLAQAETKIGTRTLDRNKDSRTNMSRDREVNKERDIDRNKVGDTETGTKEVHEQEH